MDPYFEGKKVIVTGAGKGIGRLLCITLAKQGAKVIAISRTAKDLESLKHENASIEVYSQDISDWSSTRKLIEDIGLVDMLVNNAAVDRKKPYLEIKEEDFDYLYNTNIKAAFNISQAVVKCMIEKERCGSIVNVSSIAGINPVHSIGTYSCTKAALDMMTKSMALEFGPYKIRVNSVNPTVVMTTMGRAAWSAPGVADNILKRIPNGRFAEEIDVVNAIVFLLSDKASMINGIQVPVDGGHHTNFL
ncbi:L-xylulose reductase-like [Ruditapes philippinarum]|uniref:L-xylulose reductase-like n=1 Tax=Ruditapes philippinarum TaxID=129788 RepID=UPI00295B8FFE|nr:L-xylulose reductase-like [Ruditapes philippinarum]